MKNRGGIYEDDDELPVAADLTLLNAYFQNSTVNSKGEINGENPTTWIRQKLKGDAEYIALRVERESLLLDKAAGKLVPADIAEGVLKSQLTCIYKSFDQAIDNIAKMFCDVMASGDLAMFERINGELQKELKASIEMAGSAAIVTLNNNIANYSDTRAGKL